MTEYWFPNTSTDGYVAREFADADVRHLHAFCGPCGAVQPRRLAHFVLANAGPTVLVGIKPFVAEGRRQGPGFNLKQGTLRWNLVCPSGHESRPPTEKVIAVIHAGISRVSLWSDGRISA